MNNNPSHSSHHQLAREFFKALSSGQLPDSLFTDDMTVWTITSGAATKEKYQSGVNLLQSLFPDGLRYSVDSLTAEEDRIIAEVQARGTLINGEDYHNNYVFIFRIRHGRIGSVAEYFNAIIVRDKLAPLMRAATGMTSAQ